ncbi:MAG: hypothetical protein KAR19_10325 [Bacteroidales bacterium]|nr:hypothetical protein [Bacteroidales bacterium]
MKGPCLFIILIGCISCGNSCIAQSEAIIANTNIQLKGNHVHITYDILNINKAARFEVWVEITEADGNNLEVNALKGDIGEDIVAGNNKVIIWDPEADSIFLNAPIDIQVFANMILPLPASSKEFNRVGIILQSVAFPGLGLSRVTGKPHWIKGVVGYGCIGGAIVLNKMAVASYEDYGIAESAEDANSLLSTTIRQNNISKGLAFSAIAIWVTDLTWTFIGTSDLRKEKLYSDQKGVSVGTDYDVISNTPLFSLKYTF